MIGLDTNVLVRYLVQDDPGQSERANQIIADAVKNEQILGVCEITLCEVVWVLEQCYEIERNELTHILKQLLHTRQIQIENDGIVRQALYDFEHHTNVDFSDCLIGRKNISHGCSFTYSFDKKAVKKLHTFFKMVPEKCKCL